MTRPPLTIVPVTGTGEGDGPTPYERAIAEMIQAIAARAIEARAITFTAVWETPSGYYEASAPEAAGVTVGNAFYLHHRAKNVILPPDLHIDA